MADNLYSLGKVFQAKSYAPKLYGRKCVGGPVPETRYCLPGYQIRPSAGAKSISERDVQLRSAHSSVLPRASEAWPLLSRELIDPGGTDCAHLQCASRRTC